MKKTALFFFCFLFLINASKVSKYRLDESLVNNLFASAEVHPDLQSADPDLNPAMRVFLDEGQPRIDCDPLTAFILCTFVGIIGIHRLYLGGDPVTFWLYALSLGGCGVLFIVDWFYFLFGLIRNDISSFCDPDSEFMFMWR